MLTTKIRTENVYAKPYDIHVLTSTGSSSRISLKELSKSANCGRAFFHCGNDIKDTKCLMEKYI